MKLFATVTRTAICAALMLSVATDASAQKDVPSLTPDEAKAKLDRLANLDKDIMADPRMAALQRKKVCQVAQIRRGVIYLFKHDRI